VKALVLISAVTPQVLRADWNASGIPLRAFDQQCALMLKDRSQFFYDVPKGPFFGFNQPSTTVSVGLIQSWYNQGMQASLKSTFDSITSWETDFRQDLEELDVPVIPCGIGDQTTEFLKNGRLKVYQGGPHALPTLRLMV
jgi:non-heme chloroperoxidase